MPLLAFSRKVLVLLEASSVVGVFLNLTDTSVFFLHDHNIVDRAIKCLNNIKVWYMSSTIPYEEILWETAT